MLTAPRKMAQVYAMPELVPLTQILGLRDVLIGYVMMGPSRRLGSRMRMLSDSFDGLLILSNFRSRRHSTAHVAGALFTALGSAGVAAWLTRSAPSVKGSVRP